MDKRTRMRERIQLLLRKAESTTTFEAEALTAAAAKLMLQYSLTHADVEDSDHADSIVWRDYILNGPYVDHLLAGVSTLCRSLHVECVLEYANGQGRHLLHGRKARGHTIRLFAHESDLDNAIVVLRSVARQALTAAPQWSRAMLIHRNVKVTPEDRRSFLLGYFHAAAERVEASRNQIVVEQGTGTELTLLDRWSKVRDWVKREFNIHEQDFRGDITDASNYGVQYGKDANVGESEVTMGRALTR